MAAPAFPRVLPAGWDSWTRAAASGAGCAVDYVALPLLSATGALIGNSRWGQPWPGWKEPPVLFVGEIGRPSSGKSPGLDKITGLLGHLETASNENWDERRRAHKRDCAEAKEQRGVWETEVKEAVGKKRAPPDMPAKAEDPLPVQRHRLFSTDPTIEKAAGLCHLELGTRSPANICAGCERPVSVSDGIALPHDQRVHDADCMIRFGRRWISEAADALASMGIPAPDGIMPEDAP
jgi:hypothetical protein